MLVRGLEREHVYEGKTNDVSDDGSMRSDPVAERLALRKIDWHILPLIFLYYMVSFLDR